MGEEKIKLPTTPEGWAVRISKMMDLYKAAHGEDRFPLVIADIAKDVATQFFPDEPISEVSGIPLSDAIDGMLRPIPGKPGHWGIMYNSSPDRSDGRTNFTVAHELGHYLLHRHLKPQGFQCTARNMMEWSTEHARQEGEANTFASFLLMPLNDFRDQFKKQEISFDLVRLLADRYRVSLTAVILKWLSITNKRAMLVVGKSGFIDWSWSSEPLFKSGVYYKARQETVELPSSSAAGLALSGEYFDLETKHHEGVWVGREPVKELLLLSPKNEVSLSILVYPNTSPRNSAYRGSGFEDEPLWDSYDQFKKHG